MSPEKLHAVWAENHSKFLQLLEENEVPYFGISGSTEPDYRNLLGQHLYFTSFSECGSAEEIFCALMNMARYSMVYTIKGRAQEDHTPGCLVLINLTYGKGLYMGDDQKLNHSSPLFRATPFDTDQQLNFLVKPANQNAATITARKLNHPEEGIWKFLGAIEGEVLKPYFQLRFGTEDARIREVPYRLAAQKIVAESLKIIFSKLSV